jgi:hypothetical protein
VTRKGVARDIAQLRRATDRVGSEADPIPPLLFSLACLAGAILLLRKAVQEATR